jgi:pimeloyl-ACP methyl ester carboxylesterase
MGAPELRKLDIVTEVYDEQLAALTPGKLGKLIYVGVYGGDLPSWSEAEGFDPQHWLPYEKIDPSNDSELNAVAYRESVLNVIGLRAAKQFPNSVTLVVRGDSVVVADTVEHFYNDGDRVYLAGFSNGGSVIVDAAGTLQERGIPVQMTAQVDSFGFIDTIPANVTRAFNFYLEGDYWCRGRSNMVAEDPGSTHLTNNPISDPQGPFTGNCSVHRNMDSDPRVWKAIVNYIIKTEWIWAERNGGGQ